jgi:hypothetical protein
MVAHPASFWQKSVPSDSHTLQKCTDKPAWGKYFAAGLTKKEAPFRALLSSGAGGEGPRRTTDLPGQGEDSGKSSDNCSVRFDTLNPWKE